MLPASEVSAWATVTQATANFAQERQKASDDALTDCEPCSEERHQSRECSSSRSVQRLRLLASFFAFLDLGLTYLSGGNQRFDALLREAFAMVIHAVS